MQIAPLAVSDAAMLAPEEVFAGKGDIKEDAELTKAERKSRRANKKRKFKGTTSLPLPLFQLRFLFYLLIRLICINRFILFQLRHLKGWLQRKLVRVVSWVILMVLSLSLSA